MADKAIHIKSASKVYGTGQGENSFTLTVPELIIEQGTVNIIQGASGCGKSTLTDILGLISPMSRGTFKLGLRDRNPIYVDSASERVLAAIRRRYIGYVLQAGGLLGFLTVHDNIALSMKLARGWVDERRIRRLASEEVLNITECLNKKPCQISLGQRQRAAIARSLAHQPEIVIADEPTGAVDPERAQQIKQLLLSCAREEGATTLVVTHDPNLFSPGEIDHSFGFTRNPEGSGTQLIQTL